MVERKEELWKTDSLARTYIEEVRGGLPCGHEQIDVMLRVIEARGEDVSRFADLGCGSGILASAILSRYPKAFGLLLDFSGAMIKKAESKFRGHSANLRFIVADLSDMGWSCPLESEAPYDLVVSGYAIHHLTDERKRDLYREIFGLLSPGGLFINTEHVSSSSSWIESISDNLHVDSVYAFHAMKGSQKTRDEISNEYVLRPDQQANILAPVEIQCDWLRDCGFRDVDCYFKIFERAVFGGRRPK
jgi:SAM-dependent methyltransferase